MPLIIIGLSLFLSTVSIAKNTSLKSIMNSSERLLAIDEISFVEEKEKNKVVLFSENWDAGNFTTNNWSFEPSQGNWTIDPISGNPPPNAKFHYQPIVSNYSYILLSPVINIIETEGLIFSFDLMLSDYGGTRNEILKAEILDGEEWVKLVEFNNTINIPWTNFSYDVSNISSGQTRLRFVASGVNSNDINYWMIDNIHLYEDVPPVFELTPLSSDFGQVLVGTTSAPQVFTLSNTGGSSVILSSITLTGEYSGEFILEDINTYPFTLNGGEFVEVLVSFAPQGEGIKTASLQVEHSLGVTVASLTGEGYLENNYELPFTEDWTSGTFNTNEWSFSPSQGNWSINLSSGNPEPSAKFFYSPAVTNYSYSLLSPVINLNGAVNMTLTFDLSLSDYAYNGNEHLTVWVLEGTEWTEVDDFSNTNDIDWTSFTYEFLDFSGNQTQIRFEATGVNSDNINYWMIDNIQLFQQEAPSFELSPVSHDFGQTLVGTSTAPQTFTLTNTGGGTIVVNSVVITGNNATEFTLEDLNSYPMNLGQGQSSEVLVSFAPQGEGIKTASLQVEHSLGVTVASLTGEGYLENNYELPFTEDWTSGTFNTNEWSFSPSQGNWSINLSSGNPEPSAKFFYSPAVTNYSYSLLSPVINLNGAVNMTLTFDLSLSDYAYNGNEHLTVWVLEGTEWTEVDDFSNTNDIDWTSFTYEFLDFSGNQTQIRFEATGVNSDNINYWMIDNISLISNLKCQNFIFGNGWNSMSTYLIPEVTDIENMFDPIVDELIIIRDLENIYWPAENINTIVNYDNTTGYVIKVLDDVEFILCGNNFASKQITLAPGWHYLPVLSECDVNVEDLINEYTDNVVIIQDLMGVNMYWPAMGIFTLENLISGASYKIKIENEMSLSFPVCSEKSEITDFTQTNNMSTPWGNISLTPFSQINVFTDQSKSELLDGDIIGAFDQNNNVYGTLEVNKKLNNQAMVLFGNCFTSESKTGFDQEDEIFFKVFRPNTLEEFETYLSYDKSSENLTGKFILGSSAIITKMDLFGEDIKNSPNASINIYPNPTCNKVKCILFGNYDNDAELTIFDSKGNKLVTKKFKGSFEMNISNLEPSIYYLIVKSENFIKSEKLIKF